MNVSTAYAVVFDLDGVLVDSHETMGRAFAAAYAQVVGAGPAPFAEYQRYQGMYFPEIMRRMGLPLEMEEPFVQESFRLASQVPVCAGVVDLLESLRGRGFRLAVATGKAGPRARSLLTTLDLIGYFDEVVGSDEVADPKPAPDIVLRALRLMDVRPEAALMVGDEAALSFLGVGVKPPTPSWGQMLTSADVWYQAAPQYLLLPAGALFVTVLALTVLGDGVRTALDPRAASRLRVGTRRDETAPETAAETAAQTAPEPPAETAAQAPPAPGEQPRPATGAEARVTTGKEGRA